MRRRERAEKKGRRGGGGTRGIQVWGKRGKAREGHEENPGKSPAARMYGLKYVSFTTSIARS